MTSRVPAGVAAGHPATATAGLGVLMAGGNAADAACAMVLAGCVAETLFTGLGGGGFATFYDVETKTVTSHNFFVAVPGLDGTPLGRGSGISVTFGGGVPVPYDVGGATVAVPGTPAGVEHLHRSHGSLDWRQVVEPARDLAHSGTPFPRQHSSLLTEVYPAFMVGAGIAAYSTEQGGERRLLQPLEVLFHQGLAATLDGYAAEGSGHLMSGDFAAEFVDEVRRGGGALSKLDLDSYRPQSTLAQSVRFGPNTVHLRGDDLDDMAGTLSRLDADAVAAGGVSRVQAFVAALAGTPKRSDTTSCVAVDPTGNACAATHSLGLGSGVWVRGVHGNSMLGEGELLRGEMIAGQRMGSMMTPLVATDADGELLIAGGAAGGSRIRSALLQVLTATLLEGQPVPTAIANPRLAFGGDVVHLEPGFPAGAAAALTAAGYRVLEWENQAPYFGGVSMAGRTGLAADPRRGGHALLLS
jgi:gamma-glutamyltranspeptidase/glutathione hydrolase